MCYCGRDARAAVQARRKRMVNLEALWRKAAALLQQAGIEDAAFDARELCRMCCGADPLCAPQAPVSEAARRRLAQLCARRAQHEPLQYLLGEWDFLDFTVEVGPGVLIPRPDTECVAETGHGRPAAHGGKAGLRLRPAALDLCAGTGVLAIAMARSVPAAQVAAVEKSGAAFRYLQRNCAALAPRTVAVQADVFGYENVLAPQSVDVIVSNPPYVTAPGIRGPCAELFFEPREALVAQQEGLCFYHHIAPAYFHALKSGRGTCIRNRLRAGAACGGALHRGWVHGRFCALRCRRPAALRICRKTVKRVQKRRMFIAFARGFGYTNP